MAFSFVCRRHRLVLAQRGGGDHADFATLEKILWRQAERVSARAKSHGLAGHTIVLKLKTSDFRLRTRSTSLDAPTQLADRIFRVAQAALKREATGVRFRLLGVGLSNLTAGAQADPSSLIAALKLAARLSTPLPAQRVVQPA